jgi:RHS repeat-associated protein
MIKRSLLLLFACTICVLVKSQTYTIALQPSTPGYDAIINSASVTTNYGSDTKIRASRNTSSKYERSLLKFDLAGIPANASVVTASLILYGSSQTTSVSNAAYLQTVLATWDEGTITWNTGSGLSNATGQISLSASTGASDNYTIDVATSVQSMINTPNLNFGWQLKMQTESNVNNSQMQFYSSDDATPANRPKLIVTYELPVDVRAYITPSYSTSTTDGGIALSVSGGVPPFTYAWSNSATTKDISGLAPGLYTVTVTDANSFQAKKIIPVSTANGNNGSFTVTSDGLSFKDAKVQMATLSSNIANTNYGTFNTLHVIVQNQSSGWNTARSELAFDLSAIPSNAVVTTAVLKLTTLNPSTTSLYLTPITQKWDENTVTWNNQPATDDANSISFNTTSGTTVYTLNVATPVQKMIQQGTSLNGWQIRLQSEVTGTNVTTFWKSSDNSSSPELSLVYTIPSANYDKDYNWIKTEVFDENESVISANKIYSDGLGRQTQNLEKNAINEVFTSQTVYDQYGRAALNTLPAFSGNTLLFQPDFFKNGSAAVYSYSDFDTPSTLNNPSSVQTSSVNSLGYYYSNSNAYDTYQATATNPFSRVEYTGDPMGGSRRTSQPGNQFKMGSGRESWNFSMVSGTELKGIFGANNSYKGAKDADGFWIINPLNTGGIIATKNISLGPDMKEMISYSVGGKIIATCLSGLSTDNCSITGVKSYMNYYGTKSIDVHLPDANKTSLTLPLPTYTMAATAYTAASSDMTYVITDLYTDKVLVANTDYTLNTSTRAVTFSTSFLNLYPSRGLVLRIIFGLGHTMEDNININGAVISDAEVAYSVDYGKWSINYYDLAGNLRKEVSPKGINCSSPGSITMSTSYDYNHMGQVIAKKSPDEGLVEMNYDSEGKMRFTQNALQHTGNRFSYVNYDARGRVVENGEFTTGATTGTANVFFQNYYGNYSAPNSGNTASTATVICESLDGLTDSQCSDVYHTLYEAPTGTVDIPSGYTYKAQYNTKYLNGAVCKTWNENTATWYNYDAMGRNIATVKQILDATYTGLKTNVDDQIKTSETVYNNYNSSVNKSIFQLNVSGEKMEILSVYDALLRPYQTYMNSPSGSGLKLNETSFDKMGRSIRDVIGNNLQGIDMVYTLNGKLKAINHPGLDYTLDRGGDNGDYTGAATSVNKDLFGEILEYHYNDYEAPNTFSVNSIVSGSAIYDGLIHTQRFKTRNDVNGTETGMNYIDRSGSNEIQLINSTNYLNKELIFSYTYDQYKQLATSAFGTYTNSTNTYSIRNEYKESGASGGNIAYDANGNITRLMRAAYTTTAGLMYSDDLTYTNGSTNNMLTSILDAAQNIFSGSVSFKTTSTVTPQSLTYNNIGQLTANASESVSIIDYYPEGKPKKITFTNSNYTEYYYDDSGDKYKTVFFNNSNSKKKVTWHVGSGIYVLDEVVSTTAINLDEMDTPTGQIKRNGTIYDNIYRLSDHLGNVRVTYKESGTGNGINILSTNDYYAWGGTLPGRAYTSSSYRYGYQGQEKSPDGGLWDQFELRLYNHDLGRWMAPDPEGQFHSPYIGMGNDPINNTDPDGGYSIPPNFNGEGGNGAWRQVVFNMSYFHCGFYEAMSKGPTNELESALYDMAWEDYNYLRLTGSYHPFRESAPDLGSDVIDFNQMSYLDGSTANHMPSANSGSAEYNMEQRSGEAAMKSEYESQMQALYEQSGGIEHAMKMADSKNWSISGMAMNSSWQRNAIHCGMGDLVNANEFLEVGRSKKVWAQTMDNFTAQSKPDGPNIFKRIGSWFKGLFDKDTRFCNAQRRGKGFNDASRIKKFWGKINNFFGSIGYAIGNAHFSVGLRLKNTVIFDIRYNSHHNKYETYFPGRHDAGAHVGNRLSFFYHVGSSTYMPWRGIKHMFWCDRWTMREQFHDPDKNGAPPGGGWVPGSF